MSAGINRALALVAICFVCWAGPALPADGPVAPFGLEWGMSMADAEALGVKLSPSEKKGGTKYFEAKGVPKVLADMEHVFLDFGFSGKLWKIVAISKSFEHDPYGSQVRSRYEEMLALLQDKYGKGKSVHQRGDSIYAEPQYFLSGIQQGRTFYYTDFQNSDVAVQLGIKARGNDEGFWVLFYENRKLAQEYEKERKEREKKSL